jgi:hypothetical protein
VIDTKGKRRMPASKGKIRVSRSSGTGRFITAIDDADAREFRTANTALIKEVTSSKAKAVEVLKDSGFLTQSGKRAKRYR